VATTWNDLVSYVRLRYEIFRQSDRTLDFELPTSGGRSQRVAVHHIGADGSGDGTEWIQIESPIARADSVDLVKLLELAGESEIGGVAVAGGVAMFRHAAALTDMRLSAFDRPFQLVVNRADELEHALTGADHF
jgi:hypothetical protein